MRKRVITIIISLIYTIFMAVGTSFIKSNSFKYLIDNLIMMIILSLLLFIVKRIPDYNPISIPNVTDFKLGNAQVATPLTGCSGSIFL